MIWPLLLTIGSATLYAASFPPLALSSLAYVALVPWLIACSRVAPRRAALLGMLWGVVAAYGVGWWFPEMLTDYFELPLWLGWLGFFGAALLFSGTYFGAFAAGISWLSRRGAATPLTI